MSIYYKGKKLANFTASITNHEGYDGVIEEGDNLVIRKLYESGSVIMNNDNTILLNGTVNEIINRDAITNIIFEGGEITGENFLEENIKKDVVLFGKTGTYEGESSGGGSTNLALALIEEVNTNSTGQDAYNYLFSNKPSLAFQLEGQEIITLKNNADYLFYNCDLNTYYNLVFENSYYHSSNRGYFKYMFYKNTNLKSINITFDGTCKNYGCDMINAFSECESLEEINIINDTLKLYRGNNMFNNCAKLKTINAIISIENTSSNMFYGCKSLENVVFDILSIKRALTLGYGDVSTSGAYGTKLTIDSLLSACRGMQSGLTLTVGTANLNKLASVYVDSNGYQVEEGTEGAMTVENYMSTKSCILS